MAIDDRATPEVTFVQTRAPAPLWRYVRRVAMAMPGSDGTATRLCTDHFVEFLQLRPWGTVLPWRQPKNVKDKDGPTGFIQVNLPLSRLDGKGHEITKRAYLEEAGLLDLFEGDPVALKEALKLRSMALLLRLAAAQQGVSGATMAYTYLLWLSAVRYRPANV